MGLYGDNGKENGNYSNTGGLNICPYHVEVHLGYQLLQVFKEYGTIIMVVIYVPTIRLYFLVVGKD